MKGWRYALLIFELFLFALILVLPQVDLPDFTFPRGSAPITAKARLCSRPAFSTTRAPVQAHSVAPSQETRTRTVQHAVDLNSLPPVTLNCNLRC